VKGPFPAKVSRSSAALRAASRVEKCSFSSSKTLRLLSPAGLLVGLGLVFDGPTGLLERLLGLADGNWAEIGGLAGTLPGAPGLLTGVIGR